MKNIRLMATDNNTITVTADTERFGENAIMYEGHTWTECCDYVRRVSGTNHFKLESYRCAPLFTDTEGRSMPWILRVVTTEGKESV